MCERIPCRKHVLAFDDFYDLFRTQTLFDVHIFRFSETGKQTLIDKVTENESCDSHNNCFIELNARYAKYDRFKTGVE